MRPAATLGAVLAAALILTAGSAMPAASGVSLQVNDPRDVGRKLDLRVARTAPSEGCRTTISTWGPWTSSLLRGRNYAPGKNRLGVVFRFNGDKKADATGYLISEGRRGLSLFVTTNGGSYLAPRPAARSGLSRAIVDLCDFMFIDNLDPRPTSIRVAFLSLYGTHRDRMPNHGWLSLHSKLLTG